MSRRAAALVAVGVGATLVVVAAIASSAGSDERASATTRPTATTRIERKDLVESEEVDGTLGYAGGRTVINRLSGTVTWVANEGSVVRSNHKLYEVDGQPVYLLDGRYPVYRTLAPGLAGKDVRQLERNLRDLGLDEDGQMKVDGTWDGGTTEAVRNWQRRKGMDDDGSIELGRLVFQPGDRRVGEHLVDVGGMADGGGGAASPDGGSAASAADQQATAASEIVTTTSKRRIVTVDLVTTKQRLAKRGAEVEIELPDGDEVKGSITGVGTVATSEPQADGSEGDPTIELTIALDKSTGFAVDQAPVDVRLEQRRANDVLTVPVTALLSRSGGGFAVEVVEGDRHRIVPVEPGLYTDGDVEIEGDGLDAGMVVTDARV